MLTESSRNLKREKILRDVEKLAELSLRLLSMSDECKGSNMDDDYRKMQNMWRLNGSIVSLVRTLDENLYKLGS